MTVNDYVEVDFLGFVKVIDALGGVNICLPQAVSDSYSGLLPVGRRAPRQRHHRPGVRPRPAFLRQLRPGPHPGSAATAVVGPHSGHPLWAAGQPASAVVVHQSVAVADRGPGPERVSARGSDARHLRPRRDVHDRAAGRRDYQTPTGELAVQWDTQAAGQLFQALANDQNLATPAPSGPSRAAGATHSSSPPGGSGTASGGSPSGAASGSGTAAPGGPASGRSGGRTRRRTPADSAYPRRPGPGDRPVTMRRSAGRRPSWLVATCYSRRATTWCRVSRLLGLPERARLRSHCGRSAGTSHRAAEAAAGVAAGACP